MNEYKRILSIDGGGIKGVFPAAFLADIEETLPEPIYKYFDLIVGTSTGGIIALGLALGMSAFEILEFYKKYGPEIFSGNRFVLTLKQFFYRKYSHKKLKSSLGLTFGDRIVGDCKTRLVITSFNANNGSVCLFKTAHNERFERDFKLKAVEVALATASAPTYFPILINSLGFTLVDGGVWANNPIGVAVAEGLGVLDWQKNEIKVLSLGCTDEPFDIGFLRKWSGSPSWIWKNRIIETFMIGQSNGALGIAYSLLGHENVFRINETVKKGKFSLDSAGKISELQAFGNNQARHNAPKLKPIFFRETAEEFIPFNK